MIAALARNSKDIFDDRSRAHFFVSALARSRACIFRMDFTNMIITAATAVETDRLAKLIRLIFSTDKTGEAVAAIAAVKRILAAEKKDGHWLADQLTAPITLPPPDKRAERDERDDVWFCFHHRKRLSARDRAFIENIVGRSTPLSEKQRQWLFDIVERLEEAA